MAGRSTTQQKTSGLSAWPKTPRTSRSGWMPSWGNGSKERVSGIFLKGHFYCVVCGADGDKPESFYFVIVLLQESLRMRATLFSLCWRVSLCLYVLPSALSHKLKVLLFLICKIPFFFLLVIFHAAFFTFIPRIDVNRKYTGGVNVT